MSKELHHHGIKGMRWGVRRYRNEDGSLTKAGKARYYREADAAGYTEESYNGRRYKTTKKGKTEGFNADPEKWARNDLSGNKRVADEAANLASKVKKLNDDSLRNRPKKQMDLSSMTDKEMRDQINRAILERQYNDMFNPENTSRGREHVSRVLETAGTVLAIGSSALGIALAIKELKG